MANLPPLFDLQRILPLIESHALILTPNNRLRSKILQAWGVYQQSQKTSVWPTPRIAVIEQWFGEQWEELQAQGLPESARIILSGEQQRVIWESITADCGLMQTEAVAKQAANAYNTLVRWNLPTQRHLLDANINEQFAQWIHLYQQQLKSLNSITLEQSFSIVGEAFEQNQLTQESAIHLLGFDDLSPLLNEQLSKACETLHFLPLPSSAPLLLQRVECDNTDAEMQTAAQWARSILEQQDDARIGIIVPNLGQSRQQVERAFTHEFEAHSFSPDTERYTLPFNFSAGTPLGDTPLIAATLQLLKLQEQQGNTQEWEVEFLVNLLLSPFWGQYTPELERRSALANKLQALGVFTISGDTLRYWAEKIDTRFAESSVNNGLDSLKTSQNLDSNSEAQQSQGLFDYLNALHQLSANTKGKRLPSLWIDIFLQQLDILQWPGERTPDSQEYQQTQLWYQLLETFASLDSVLNAITSTTALQQLQSMAKHMPFQAKVPDSPIQILGILEGAGLHFTHCWVMGLHQKVWPPAPAPNSLLPIRMQREHNMPHASSLRELEYAQSLTDNYRHCASDTIIFSSPHCEDDSEQPLLVSQLISDIPVHALITAPAEDSLDHLNHALSQNEHTLERVNCSHAPAFTPTELPGGSGLFKAQAENPFDSFVKYRLGASLPIEAVNGFSHIEKGNILHNSLAAIWQQLKTQENLLTLNEDTLDTLISEQVNNAIRDIKRHKPKHLSEPLCQVESERQSQLIKQWLEIEKKRPPFTVVAIEQAQTIRFNGMSINIRIDRVDQLQDGRYLIIDYKTGQANLNAWKGERPKEPQLPLYALVYHDDSKNDESKSNNSSDESTSSTSNESTNNNNASNNISQIKGISFAQINIKDQTFKGLGDGDISHGISHIEKNRIALPDTWEKTLEHWQNILSQLLSEFQQGHCSIEYIDELSKTYARDYLRINRFYEAEAIEKLGEPLDEQQDKELQHKQLQHKQHKVGGVDNG